MTLVFGQTGQVARELQLLCPNARFLGRQDVDLVDPKACADQVFLHRPALVINAAAWTAVDKAEEEEDLVYTVNASAPTAMAEACAELGIPFVTISTDYVFDGSGDQPFSPTSAIAPLGVYGASKAAGEAGVRQSRCDHIILRTSWVFSPFGQNFLKTMLRLGKDREVIKVVADQVGGPTPARAIADACLQMGYALKKDKKYGGTYHFSGKEDVSWADFARVIFEVAGYDCRVEDIATADYPTAAKRPPNSRLDCTSLKAFGLIRPDWKAEVKRIISELESEK